MYEVHRVRGIAKVLGRRGARVRIDHEEINQDDREADREHA